MMRQPRLPPLLVVFLSATLRAAIFVASLASVPPRSPVCALSDATAHSLHPATKASRWPAFQDASRAPPARLCG
ncbi:hypothetical protein J3F83DRAFT_725607 [Trichoderma novae-zelandiae]